jgi:hypothetical protein
MDSFWTALVPATGLRRFESLIRPLAIEPISVVRACSTDTGPLCLFLEEFFGSSTGPTLKPVLDPSKEIILFVQEKGSIVASIRYKYAGLFENQPIHIIDCFCVHPSKRKSGLATKLLGTLHHYTNERQLRYSLFLKEGRALPNHQPLYSSHYVFRPCSGHLKTSLSPLKARALVAAYRQLYPDTLWIYDIDNVNQQWLFWKEGLEWILVCIQDAYQTHKGGRIGWISACFASEFIRSEPFERLLEQAPYSWIWMDGAWLPKESTNWSIDGPFHWYAYQWSTNLSVRKFYGIVV